LTFTEACNINTDKGVLTIISPSISGSQITSWNAIFLRRNPTSGEWEWASATAAIYKVGGTAEAAAAFDYDYDALKWLPYGLAPAS
jgi:hypothetical protein